MEQGAFKVKTFEQIVPLWSEKLKRGYDAASHPCLVDGQELDIALYSTCIVGEAYKFAENPDHLQGYSVYDDEEHEQYCSHCENFAGTFATQLKDLAYAERECEKTVLKIHEEQFEREKERFVEHWNDKHL